MPAGFLGFRPTTTSGSGGNAPGAWNLREVFDQRRAGNWPSKYVTPVAANAPTNFTATAGDTQVALSWTAPSAMGTHALSQYRIKYAAGSSLGFSPTIVNTGSTSTTHTITGLTNAQQYAFQVQAITNSGLGLVGAASAVITSTPAAAGITPNTDASARFYLPASQTTFKVSANTSTGYYKISSPGKTDVIGQEYLYTAPTYYAGINNGTTPVESITMSGLSSSAVKTVTLTSCTSNGTASGSLNGVDIGNETTNNVTAVDVSGCTNLSVFHAGAVGVSGINSQKFWSGGGPAGIRRMASSIEEVRAVNCDFNSANGYTNPYGNTIYPNAYGWDVAGHDMNATALNQLYTDLAAGTGGGGLFVGGNPGVSSDNPSIASNYSIHGSS